MKVAFFKDESNALLDKEMLLLYLIPNVSFVTLGDLSIIEQH